MTCLAGSRRWELLAHDQAAEHELETALGVSALVARVLSARHIREPEEARRFLSPDLVRDWEPPLDIPGMREACDRVERALVTKEQIAVFGDFDVDGMSATALLTLALRRLGGKVEPYIPHRFGEGYGLSREALTRVIEGCNPTLLITVDNGIAAHDEVAWLTNRGIDVVITDHHEPGELVPQGVPVTDPKLSESCASRELAGVGVALKMVAELGVRLGHSELWREYTDLAALGTVSDMMMLLGENRSLVADGITRLRCGFRPGMVALAAAAGTDLASITSDALPFTLIPRLNAAGRMGTTDIAFDLMMTDDPTQAATLAAALEQTNTERREIESQLTDAAIAQADVSYDGGRAVVVAGVGWHEGVKGIVASRLVSCYHVPSIVFTIDDGIARGSGRSVGSVDLFHAVEQCSDLLLRFGGHAGAVGVTCEQARLPEFRQRLETALAQLPAEQFIDHGEISTEVGLHELTIDGIEALDALQPFGQGNKRPLFIARGISMRNRACVGMAGAHLRFVASDGENEIPAIMFRVPNIDKAVSCETVVDLVFDAVNETWQGRTKPKLMVRDILYRDDTDPLEESLTDQELSEGLQDAALEEESPTHEREYYAQLTPEALTDELRQLMIGDNRLLPAQRLALDRLQAGLSTLTIMATGRGKSLIFHIEAARQALAHGRASIFVYPLRALVNDQANHLIASFAQLGLTATVLTGETDSAERELIYAGLASGEIDVILTTPEYLAIHSKQLSVSHRVGFVVIDEAHHAGMAKSGNRPAYVELPRIRSELGDPVVLAVTATANAAIAREICRLVDIDETNVIIDQSVRENLSIRDARAVRERDLALAHVVASGGKCVVYVNSRSQSVNLTRTLRRSVPDLGERIAFYNAGMSRADRTAVERAFRSGQLSCIVSTSAFGEGVNIPDIRNVVLYHLPFGMTEFNQMSGRAGRDGLPATIHLLYGPQDARINEAVLSAAAPSRDEMAIIYRALKAYSDVGTLDGTPRALHEGSLTELLDAFDAKLGFTTASIEAALAVFSELDLVVVEGFGSDRRVRLKPNPARVELEDSVRYVEGLREQEAFAQFCSWALTTDAERMLEGLNRPLIPSFGQVVDG